MRNAQCCNAEQPVVWQMILVRDVSHLHRYNHGEELIRTGPMSSHHLDEMDAPQPGEKNISALELSFLEHILFHVLYENTESERFARASWKHGHVRSENIPPALIISSPG